MARVRKPSELLRRAVDVLARENSSPLRLGAGVAIGTLIGMTPLYGFHLVLAVGLAALLRVNLAGAALATQISNPVLAPALVLLSVRVGNWMGAGSPALAAAGSPGFLKAWAAGGLALGAGAGILLGTLAGGWRALLLARRGAPSGGWSAERSSSLTEEEP
jgi:uncharacterized protein (DUF2062 family)